MEVERENLGKEQIISVGSISAKTEIEVLCYSGGNSKTVAKYTINVQDDAGFLLAGDDGKITSDNPKRIQRHTRNCMNQYP